MKHRAEITKLKPFVLTEPIEIKGIGSLLRCGFPNPADNFFRNAINIGDVLIKNPDSTYYGYADSDSMEPLINEGAIVLVDISLIDSVRNGSYVVCELEGDLCIKRFWKENGVITLLSENPDYPPVVVREGVSFKIFGKVTNIIKSL